MPTLEKRIEAIEQRAGDSMIDVMDLMRENGVDRAIATLDAMGAHAEAQALADGKIRAAARARQWRIERFGQRSKT